MARPGYRRLLQSAFAAAICSVLTSTAATSQPLGFQAPSGRADPMFDAIPQQRGLIDQPSVAEDLPAHLRRRVVSYVGHEPAGTIIIDTSNTYLYFVIGNGKAIRYGIGVGREGFAWSGVKNVDHKSEWPDWIPPAEMIERQPYLPRFMAGGPSNPLGARAIYLGGTLYRIHGTNAPSTIGKRVSSGCIRMLNEDVVDLYARVNVGTRVVVLPLLPTTRPSVAARDRLGLYRAPDAVAGAMNAFGFY